MRTLIPVVAVASCSLEEIIQKDKVAADVADFSNVSTERHAPETCSGFAMKCSLSEETEYNLEGSSVDLRCIIPHLSCVTTLTYDAGDLGTDILSQKVLRVRVYSTTIETNAVPAGTYNIIVIGTSSSGETTSTTLPFEVIDANPPSVSCTTYDGANDKSEPITISCTADDETALTSVYYISTDFGYDDLTNTSDSTYEATIEHDKAGTYTLSVYAEDSAGNISKETVSVDVHDVIAPEVLTVYADPNTVLSDGSESFTVSACFNDETDGTELGGDTSVTIDSVLETFTYDASSACFVSSAINGNNFLEGTYTITVYAKDTAGNDVTDESASVSIVDHLTTTLYTDSDARTSEEIPNSNFEGSALYIGASSRGRGRSYIAFDSSEFEGENIISAVMTIYATGGSCHSSSSSTDCNHAIVGEVREVTSSWDPATVTWNTAPTYDEATVIASTTITEPYGGGGSYDFDITTLVQTWADGTNNGLILKGDTTGENTGYQVDISIGSSESKPAKLEVTYGP